MKEFESGNYSRVVDSSPAKSTNQQDQAAVICALSFLGRIDEALEYWKIHQSSLSPQLQSRCRFSIAVALTRISRLTLARKMFKENLIAAKNDPSLLAYAYQGIGFYYYFVGRFSDSEAWAKKASTAALKSENKWIRFLAIDLLGHSKVQLGLRNEGLSLMKQAAALARSVGNKNFANAFTIAALIYEAEAGWRPQTMLKELEEALSSIEVSDSYTRSNLILELARQLTLRGRWSEVKETLSEASTSIYAYGNRRQEFFLQVRLAELAFSQGDFFLVEHFIRSAQRCLNVVADKAFEVRLMGLERKYLTQRRLSIPKVFDEKLVSLSKNHGSHINDQILFRSGLTSESSVKRTDDPVHYLFLKNLKDSSVAQTEAIKLGYFGLWQKFKELAPGKNYFVVLQDQKSFIISTPAGVIKSDIKLSKQQLQILSALASGQSSKALLIQTVWGYEYDPARHDSLLHTTIAKLRKVLNLHASWIQTAENGWSLHSEVIWLLPQLDSYSAQKPETINVAQVDNFANFADLNFRQVRALQILKSERMWSITQYKSHFGVSTMTAFRDLQSLLNSEYLVKTGRARATRYHLHSSVGVKK